MMKWARFLAVVVALTLILSGCTLTVSTSPPSNPSAREPNWGVQTKTSGCMAQNGLQDSACTPGAIFTNATKDAIRLVNSKSTTLYH